MTIGRLHSRNFPHVYSRLGSLAIALIIIPVFSQDSPLGKKPENERVLVVYNASAPNSRSVAEYYMKQRGIPNAHKCKVSASPDDFIGQDDFESRLKKPIRKCLELAGKQQILYIVMSYHTPFALTVHDHIYAVDQFLADIWDEYSPTRPGNEAPPHPYFGGAQSQGNAYAPFVPLGVYREQAHSLNIYSVWRLDAANDRLAKGLVEKAKFAEDHGISGKGCFDLQFGGVEALPDSGLAAGDWDIHKAAEFARRAGFAVTEDDHNAEFGTPPAPLRCDDAVLYAGWYNLNHYNDAFTWAPGAIGVHLDSASAVDPRGGANWSANAVLKGITVTSGAVSEPYLTGLPHPDQLFLYLFQGANVGDAMLRSTQWLKWTILNIGDPLYRPFPRAIAPFNRPAHQEGFLALLPSVQIGGNSCTALVSPGYVASAGGVTITLKSDHPETVTLPATLFIPEKANAAKFSIATIAVKSETTVRISMTADHVSRSNTLVLYPPSTVH